MTQEHVEQLIRRVIERCKEAHRIAFTLALMVERQPKEIGAIWVVADLLNEYLANTVSMIDVILHLCAESDGEPGDV